MSSQISFIPNWVITQNTNLVKGVMIKNRLQEIRESKNLTRDELGEMANTSGTQIYRLEKGLRKLTDEWKSILAPILNVDPADLIKIKSTAPIIGYITYSTIGGEAFAFDASSRLMPDYGILQENTKQSHKTGKSMGKAKEYEHVEIPPEVDTHLVVALKIKDDPTMPSGFNGWVVGYSQQHNRSMADMMGEICLCKIVNGPTVLRQLKTGRMHGRYDLLTLGSGPILEDREIEWCAKILFMRPGY